MTVKEMIARLDELTPDEIAELQGEIERRRNAAREHSISPAERVRRLDDAFDRLRDGLTDEEIDEITNAMNEEYIEPWDETEWQD
jgi:uncharacterized protein YeeX (DUF496 family)